MGALRRWVRDLGAMWPGSGTFRKGKSPRTRSIRRSIANRQWGARPPNVPPMGRGWRSRPHRRRRFIDNVWVPREGRRPYKTGRRSRGPAFSLRSPDHYIVPSASPPKHADTMMALRILPILQVIVILFAPGRAYPVYGTKSQTYPEDYYYPQESYPMYYPPARTSKYEVYQAVLPYYYGDTRPISRPYGYYDPDPVVDLQEEMLQEDEAQPIGHEMLYESDDVQDDNMDDVNAAFLQNLIMTQMYKDAVDGTDNQNYYDYYPREREGYYGRFEDSITPSKQPKEDEDVMELKQLAKPVRTKPRNLDDIHWFQRNNNLKETKRDLGDNKVDASRKQVVKTTLSPISTLAPKKVARGQKEEVLARPATPVRRPFSPQVLDMMSKNGEERKRSPSVYDTIKHMLDMEKSLENKYGKGAEVRPAMKKRIIASEDSLTQQLSVLKKSK